MFDTILCYETPNFSVMILCECLFCNRNIILAYHFSNIQDTDKCNVASAKHVQGINESKHVQVQPCPNEYKSETRLIKGRCMWD